MGFAGFGIGCFRTFTTSFVWSLWVGMRLVRLFGGMYIRQDGIVVTLLG